MNQKANENGGAKGKRATPRKSGARPSNGGSPSPKPGKRRSKSSAGKRGKPLSLPLFTAWLVALVMLGGLLYWGMSARSAKLAARGQPQQRPPQASAKAKPAETPPKATAPAVPVAPTPAPEPAEQKGPPKARVDEQALARSRPPEPAPPVSSAPAEATPIFEEYQQIRWESALDRVDKFLSEFLKSQGIAGDALVRRTVRHAGPGGTSWSGQEMEAQLPPDRNLQGVKEALLQKARALGPDVQFKAELPKPERLQVAVSILQRPYHRLVLALRETGGPAVGAHDGARNGLAEPKSKSPPVGPSLPGVPALGKAAIVIDDLGLDLAVAKALLAIPLPLTFSVMPQQRHSQEIARMAHAQGHEVLVHLPMEPHGYPQVNPGPGALLLSMSDARVQEALNSALESVPFAAGVNNHMGSTFTEREQPMKLVLAELRRRGLYFLDSYTTPQSIACTLAAQLHMPCGRRDIFLDHEPQEDFVRAQLNRLIREAKIQGSAVAIGHPHPATLKVLTQEAGRFNEERVAIVPLRELLMRSAPRH